MRADNTVHLVTAARHRHELTRSKALQALRELEATGAAVTFETVARHAQVSRSWLYTQPEIRADIERLRALAPRQASTPPVPAGQRASEASLQRRLQTALERNRELAEDNQRLRRQLAQTLGQLRAAAQDPSPAIRRGTGRNSVTIGPCQ